ncbi:hypothetical protein P280DRAFT_410697 [Massarina eburnea CBS 473.64]|uniref:Ima1 N-terminal domain-containing protein n=1 Tax=Massarina eburnea CBS 473.64 TaxID=1395130 RepID=A0A6A6RKQ9_9PLEO|nr:hypothetical protein P280DRAFT_410697 [Massarina eburnea CBS 473.64]
MVRLLRRNLRCHYCNATTRNEHGGIPKKWLCRNCDAVNYLDERGNITDPPFEETSTAAPPLKYVRSRSPTPPMAPASYSTAFSASEALFCDTCQRNQLLLNKTLAEYIPEEADPQYAKYVETADEYRAELEERYPQVCESCIDRVQERIRAAGYAAKADHLRRRLEQAKKYQGPETTMRQTVTLAIIELAKYVYLSSVLIGLVWHILGMMASPDRPRNFDWMICLHQAVILRNVDESCFNSPYVLQFVRYVLIADLLTIWWNPRLKDKTNAKRPGARVHGLIFVWFLRTAVLAMRYFSYTSLRNFQEYPAESLHKAHCLLFLVLATSTVLAWKSVSLTYHSTRTLMQSLDAHLPSVSSPVEPPRTPRPTARPVTSTFDTMAQSFTSSFEDVPSSAYPPSPTFTAVSTATEDSEWATPYTARDHGFGNDMGMGMDWTPTQRRFGSQTPTVLPNTFSQRDPSPPDPSPTKKSNYPQQGHSLFSRPDPNPFRHKVPAAPRGSIFKTVQTDPWNPPGTTQVPNNFFTEAKKFGEASQEDSHWNVPKNVKRQAELFEEPKLKYHTNAYGKQVPDTGLEANFNDLFSK